MALKTLANEVMEVVKGKVGSTVFTQFYNDTRKKLLATRRKRKTEQDHLAVINPQLAATKKRRKHQKQKEQRKRKIEHYRPDYAYKRSKMQ